VAHGHTASAEEEEEDMPVMVMPEELSCPISIQLMTDPVLAEDGHTYQRDAIEQWINKCISRKESRKQSCRSPCTEHFFHVQCTEYSSFSRNIVTNVGNVLTSLTFRVSDGSAPPGDVTTHRSRDGIQSTAEPLSQVTGAQK
jgi:hypothetical protein